MAVTSSEPGTRRLLVAVAVPFALAGCTSHAPRTSSAASPPGSATAAATTAVPTPSAASPTPTRAATPTPAGSTTCATDHLSFTVHQAGAAAGTAYWALDLQNTGAAPCTLTGYPGVSFTDAGGRQLGLPATRMPGQPVATVTLAPGGYAHANVGVPNPASFQSGPDPAASTCKPAQTALVRVYPPDRREALTAPLRTSVCTTSDGRTQVTAVSAGQVTGPAG